MSLFKLSCKLSFYVQLKKCSYSIAILPVRIWWSRYAPWRHATIKLSRHWRTRLFKPFNSAFHSEVWRIRRQWIHFYTLLVQSTVQYVPFWRRWHYIDTTKYRPASGATKQVSIQVSKTVHVSLPWSRAAINWRDCNFAAIILTCPWRRPDSECMESTTQMISIRRRNRLPGCPSLLLSGIEWCFGSIVANCSKMLTLGFCPAPGGHAMSFLRVNLICKAWDSVGH